MRSLLIGVTLTAVTLSLAACGGSSSSKASKEVQRDADRYQIMRIEEDWHRSASTHNLDLMMSLWAPNATFTFQGNTSTGTAAIRQLLAAAGPFQPENHWVSDTPAYKIRSTVDGNVGTLYFECHYVDVATHKVVAVVAADLTLKKLDGTWRITNAVGASPLLSA
jgi:hypothetical protein